MSIIAAVVCRNGIRIFASGTSTFWYAPEPQGLTVTPHSALGSPCEAVHKPESPLIPVTISVQQRRGVARRGPSIRLARAGRGAGISEKVSRCHMGWVVNQLGPVQPPGN